MKFCPKIPALLLPILLLFILAGCGGSSKTINILYIAPHKTPLAVDASVNGNKQIQSAFDYINASSTDSYKYVLRWSNGIREVPPGGCPGNAVACTSGFDRVLRVVLNSYFGQPERLSPALIHETAHIEFFNRMSGGVADTAYSDSDCENERHSTLHELWFQKTAGINPSEEKLNVIYQCNAAIGISRSDFSHRYYDLSRNAYLVGGDDDGLVVQLP